MEGFAGSVRLARGVGGTVGLVLQFGLSLVLCEIVGAAIRRDGFIDRVSEITLLFQLVTRTRIPGTYSFVEGATSLRVQFVSPRLDERRG